MYILILFLQLPTGPTQIIEQVFLTSHACESRAKYYNWHEGYVDLARCIPA